MIKQQSMERNVNVVNEHSKYTVQNLHECHGTGVNRANGEMANAVSKTAQAIESKNNK